MCECECECSGAAARSSELIITMPFALLPTKPPTSLLLHTKIVDMLERNFIVDKVSFYTLMLGLERMFQSLFFIWSVSGLWNVLLITLLY